MLKITDLSLIKFKRLKNNKLTFIYDDKEYIIIDYCDEDCYLQLYERIKVADNRYKINHISGVITVTKAYNLLKDISKRQAEHIVYANADREYFVKTLTKLGLIESNYTKVLENIKKRKHEIHEQIQKLNRESVELDKRFNTTAGHGSKCYGNEIKIKQAERIKGRKPGEPSKQYYGMKLGEYNKVYGGLIVDMFNLPVGTVYECTCGHYTGVIVADNKGNKCVETKESTIKLTQEHCESCVILHDKELEQDLVYKS